MKSTVVIIVSTLFLGIHYISTSSAIQYKGEYDVNAKDMAYLCKLIKEYKQTGVKPVVADETPPMPKDTYMNSKTQCWKFVWVACSDGEVGKSKPCGWYEMRADPVAANCA